MGINLFPDQRRKGQSVAANPINAYRRSNRYAAVHQNLLVANSSSRRMLAPYKQRNQEGAYCESPGNARFVDFWCCCVK